MGATQSTDNETAEVCVMSLRLRSGLVGMGLRAFGMETGKVEEHYYNTEHHAKKRLKRSIESGLEITMVSNDGLYHLRPSDTFIDWNF